MYIIALIKIFHNNKKLRAATVQKRNLWKCLILVSKSLTLLTGCCCSNPAMAVTKSPSIVVNAIKLLYQILPDYNFFV